MGTFSNKDVSNKEKFKAIIKLGGLNTPEKFAKVMNQSEEYSRQLLCRADKHPNYMNLVVHLFERFLDK